MKASAAPGLPLSYKAHVHLGFIISPCGYCQEVQKLYLVVGYKPKKKIPPVLSFQKKMESKIQCSSFLESVNRNRQQELGKEHVSTEKGALYPNTLVCLSKTIKVIHEVAARNDIKTLTEISAAYKPSTS